MIRNPIVCLGIGALLLVPALAQPGGGREEAHWGPRGAYQGLSIPRPWKIPREPSFPWIPFPWLPAAGPEST